VDDLASADPLVIELEGSLHQGAEILRYFEDEHDGWRERAAEHDDEPFLLPVAPDLSHKQGLSGGATYGFLLPDGCADGLFQSQVTMPSCLTPTGYSSAAGSPGPTASTATNS
jgi:hypothetical protein